MDRKFVPSVVEFLVLSYAWMSVQLPNIEFLAFETSSLNAFIGHAFCAMMSLVKNSRNGFMLFLEDNISSTLTWKHFCA